MVIIRCQSKCHCGEHGNVWDKRKNMITMATFKIIMRLQSMDMTTMHYKSRSGDSNDLKDKGFCIRRSLIEKIKTKIKSLRHYKIWPWKILTKVWQVKTAHNVNKYMAIYDFNNDNFEDRQWRCQTRERATIAGKLSRPRRQLLWQQATQMASCLVINNHK